VAPVLKEHDLPKRGRMVPLGLLVQLALATMLQTGSSPYMPRLWRCRAG